MTRDEEIAAAFTAYNANLLKTATIKLCDSAEADLCVSDMWIKAIEHWSECRGTYEHSRVAWLHMILRNTITSHLRQRVAMFRTGLVYQLDIERHELPDRRYTPSCLNAKLDVPKCLKRLPPKQREATELHLAGHQVEGNPVAHRIRFWRAKAAMRQMLTTKRRTG